MLAAGVALAAASLEVVVSSLGVVERVYIFSPARKTPPSEPKAHRKITIMNDFLSIGIISQVARNSGNYSLFAK
jgi:hypothetical protein